MSITKTAWALILAALLIAPPVSAQAALVRSASQLAGDKDVKKHEQPYRMISAVNAVYERCMMQFGIAPSQREYVRTKYDKQAKDYMDAFTQAYIARFRAPPPKELTDDFSNYIAAVQKDAVNAMISNIDKRGCQIRPAQDLAKFYIKLQQSEIKPPSEPAEH